MVELVVPVLFFFQLLEEPLFTFPTSVNINSVCLAVRKGDRETLQKNSAQLDWSDKRIFQGYNKPIGWISLSK